MGTLDDARGTERRHQVPGTAGAMRENHVKSLYGRLDPEQAKGLRLTDSERSGLLGRLEALRVEIDSAGVYYGADL